MQIRFVRMTETGFEPTDSPSIFLPDKPAWLEHIGREMDTKSQACPPGCTQYTSEQGCTYHGTLPVDHCEAHMVKNCSECFDSSGSPRLTFPGPYFGDRTYDPTADRARLAAAAFERDNPTMPAITHTRPHTEHDTGFGGQDRTLDLPAVPVYLNGSEWQQVIDNLPDTLLGLVKDITGQVRQASRSEQACTYSFREGRHLRRCPIGYTPDQEGLTE